jgi:hypothetical protein
MAYIELLLESLALESVSSSDAAARWREQWRRGSWNGFFYHALAGKVKQKGKGSPLMGAVGLAPGDHGGPSLGAAVMG